MTNTKKKNSRKGTSARSHAWVLALIIILIIAAVVAVIIFVVKPQPSTSEPSTPTTSDQPTSPSTPDSTTSPETGDSASAPEAPEKTQQYEGGDPNDLEELTGVVTYKGVENNTLTIMTMLNQYLHQTGICVITLTGQNSHGSYTASVDAHGDATASYCENFDIPASELPSDTYNIEIKLTGDGKTGTIRDEVKL